MEGVKRYFYVVLGFIGILLAGTTIIVVVMQFKFEASVPLALFCLVSWLLFILAALQISAAICAVDENEADRHDILE